MRLYSVRELDSISLYLISEELSSHRHPKSRQMPKNRMRNKTQAIAELIAHYQTFHSNDLE